MAPLRRSMRAQIIKDAQSSSSNIQSNGHDIEPQSKTPKTKLVTAKNISSSKRTIDPPQNPPSTPLKKPKLDDSSPKKGVTMTPTPFAATFMGGVLDKSSLPGDTTTRKPRRSRAVMPDKTNAPLRTPKGSKIVTQAQNSDPASKSPVFGISQTTTENLLERAEQHLISADPNLKPLIEKNRCRVFSPEGLAEEVLPFKSLTSGIMAQQVSVAAANSIQKKFVALFNEGRDEPDHIYPTPAQVAPADLALLRTAGLSGRKAEYIKGLAERFTSGELDTKMLVEATDDEVLEKLTAVRGLGKWSVEMFACFGLKRTDILSTGDLGVQRGMAFYAGKDVAKLKSKGGGKWKYMSEKDMLDISAKFSPYRSIFMWYMWRIEGADFSPL